MFGVPYLLYMQHGAGLLLRSEDLRSPARTAAVGIWIAIVIFSVIFFARDILELFIPINTMG
jgi:hypothetical protein